jgi:hypothetical protein
MQPYLAFVTTQIFGATIRLITSGTYKSRFLGVVNFRHSSKQVRSILAIGICPLASRFVDLRRGVRIFGVEWFASWGPRCYPDYGQFNCHLTKHHIIGCNYFPVLFKHGYQVIWDACEHSTNFILSISRC